MKWGTASTPIGGQEDDALGASTLPVAGASVQLAKERELDLTRPYVQKHRPRWGGVAAGGVLTIAGLVATSRSIKDYNAATYMSADSWETLKIVNAAGIGAALLGSGIVGASFTFPSLNGPIVLEEAP